MIDVQQVPAGAQGRGEVAPKARGVVETRRSEHGIDALLCLPTGFPVASVGILCLPGWGEYWDLGLAVADPLSERRKELTDQGFAEVVEHDEVLEEFPILSSLDPVGDRSVGDRELEALQIELKRAIPYLREPDAARYRILTALVECALIETGLSIDFIGD